MESEAEPPPPEAPEADAVSVWAWPPSPMVLSVLSLLTVRQTVWPLLAGSEAACSQFIVKGQGFWEV